ncbi:VOC family protein [Nocardioides nanhaiensis]|uniref:VOC family protein n=1 Tax=Nocardioides nanhaiensis TaxID=1476871 RepID=A0ABP8VZM6_9ACTN
MTTRWSLTIDCENPLALVEFWKVALGYEDAPPPTGWSTWESWLADAGVPREEWGDGATLHDPAGVLPSLSLLKVPEEKRTKNRVHLDLQVSGGRHVDGERRTRLIDEHVRRLVEADGQVLTRIHGPSGHLDHVVVADPEGNELCVV